MRTSVLPGRLPMTVPEPRCRKLHSRSLVLPLHRHKLLVFAKDAPAQCGVGTLKVRFRRSIRTHTHGPAPHTHAGAVDVEVRP